MLFLNKMNIIYAQKRRRIHNLILCLLKITFYVVALQQANLILTIGFLFK
jgi:hypothetical protein